MEGNCIYVSIDIRRHQCLVRIIGKVSFCSSQGTGSSCPHNCEKVRQDRDLQGNLAIAGEINEPFLKPNEPFITVNLSR